MLVKTVYVTFLMICIKLIPKHINLDERSIGTVLGVITRYIFIIISIINYTKQDCHTFVVFVLETALPGHCWNNINIKNHINGQ